MRKLYELQIVMPVYNEERSIGPVIKSWLRLLDALGVDYCIIVVNDGSTDGTAEKLAEFEQGYGEVRVISKQNTGHGPTIRHGYRVACRSATVDGWVFQVDSDNEIEAEHFPALWRWRHNRDAVIGLRTGRPQPITRRIVSATSRWLTRTLFGPGAADVNCPYRLIAASTLKLLLADIPLDTFAPNVAMTGLLSFHRATVGDYAVPHRSRVYGTTSIHRWKLLRAAVLSAWQLIAIRWRCRG
jgi:glycosyltransferase involved in cell wall biosynthesis